MLPTVPAAPNATRAGVTRNSPSPVPMIRVGRALAELPAAFRGNVSVGTVLCSGGAWPWPQWPSHAISSPTTAPLPPPGAVPLSQPRHLPLSPCAAIRDRSSSITTSALPNSTPLGHNGSRSTCRSGCPASANRPATGLRPVCSSRDSCCHGILNCHRSAGAALQHARACCHALRSASASAPPATAPASTFSARSGGGGGGSNGGCGSISSGRRGGNDKGGALAQERCTPAGHCEGGGGGTGAPSLVATAASTVHPPPVAPPGPSLPQPHLHAPHQQQHHQHQHHAHPQDRQYCHYHQRTLQVQPRRELQPQAHQQQQQDRKREREQEREEEREQSPQQQQLPLLPAPHSATAGGWWRRHGEAEAEMEAEGVAAAGADVDVGPAPGRLQIWWSPLEQESTCSPARVSRYTGCLSGAETAEVAAGKDLAVAAKRTAARALARCVLARAVTAEVAAAEAVAAEVAAAAEPAAEPAATAMRPLKPRLEGGAGGATATAIAAATPVAAPRYRRSVVLPQDLVFRRNPHGKPHLVARPGWPALHHNLTHTHDLAGVAVFRPPRTRGPWSAAESQRRSSPSSTSPSVAAAPGAAVQVSYGVGLDVERLDRVPRDPLALARRRLAPAEVRDLEALSGEDRARHFMWLWTLKEAYVKARGTGISAPPGLKGFAIGFEDVPAARTRELAAVYGDRYRLAPALKTITLRHNTTAGAAAAAGGAATAASAPNGPPPSSLPSPAPPAPPPFGADGARRRAGGAGGGAGAGEEWCGFEGPDTHFSFLLFQPTPRHVGALCLAVHPAAAAVAAAPTHGSSSTSFSPRLAAGPAVESWRGDAVSGDRLLEHGNGNGWGCVGGLEGDAVGGGDGRGWRGSGAAAAADMGVGVGAEEAPGSLAAGGVRGGDLAALVEQWWCVPLEAEGRLGRRELTLLGLS